MCKDISNAIHKLREKDTPVVENTTTITEKDNIVREAAEEINSDLIDKIMESNISNSAKTAIIDRYVDKF